MKITLRQLEVFAAIASFGQVTRAAQSVAITQSAASMALADLERQLDAPLFDRVGRRLVLNETGRMLINRARDVIDRARDIEALAGDTGSAFDIRLGASVTVGNHLLPDVIRILRQTTPNGRVHIQRFNTEQVLEKLLSFEIDVGFVEGPVEDIRFRCLDWKVDELVVFAAPTHSLAGRSLKPSDLGEAQWILRENGSGSRVVFERACAENGITPCVTLELEQPEAIRQCVRAGLGISCLSRLDLEDSFARGLLVPLSTPFLQLHRRIDVVLNQSKYLSHGIAAILQACGLEAIRPV